MKFVILVSLLISVICYSLSYFLNVYFHTFYELVSPKYICWNPKPLMWLLFQIGLLRRLRLRLNEVIRVEPESDRTAVLIRKTPESSLILSTEEKPCQDTARRWREGLHQEPILMTPWSCTSSLQNGKKIHFSWLSCQVWGILLRQPKQTNAISNFSFLNIFLNRVSVMF